MATLIPPTSIDDIHLHVASSTTGVRATESENRVPLYRKLGQSARKFFSRRPRDAVVVEARTSTAATDAFDSTRLSVSAAFTPDVPSDTEGFDVVPTTASTPSRLSHKRHLTLAIQGEFTAAKNGWNLRGRADSNGHFVGRARLRNALSPLISGYDLVAAGLITPAGSQTGIELSTFGLDYSASLSARQTNKDAVTWGLAGVFRDRSRWPRTLFGVRSELIPTTRAIPIGRTTLSLNHLTPAYDLTVNSHVDFNGAIDSLVPTRYSAQLFYKPSTDYTVGVDMNFRPDATRTITSTFALETVVDANTTLKGEYNTENDEGRVGLRHKSGNLVFGASVRRPVFSVSAAPSFGVQFTYTT